MVDEQTQCNGILEGKKITTSRMTRQDFIEKLGYH